MRPIHAFWVLALATFLERWAWSGYRAVLVLHLLFYWGLDTANDANYWFASLIYFLPVLASFRLTSMEQEKNAVQMGAIVFGLGYLLLAFTTEMPMFALSFSLLIVGRSFVINTLPALLAKVNASRKNLNDLDVWMTRLYMFSNAGSFVGPVVAGILFDWGGNYQPVFLVSALVSMACWWLVYYFCQRWNDSPAPTAVAGATAAPAAEGRDIYAAVALVTVTAFSVVFWSGFEQKSGPLTLIAAHFTDLQVGPFAWQPTWFQAINPFFVVALAPVFDYLWRQRDSRRSAHPISPFFKLASGLVFLSLGFWVLHLFRSAGHGSPISWSVLVLVYLFHTIGELLLEPIGQSLVLKLASPRWQILYLSIWNSSTSFALLLASVYPWLWGANEANHYASMWLGLAIMTLAVGVLMFLVAGPLTNRCRHLLFEQPAQ